MALDRYEIGFEEDDEVLVRYRENGSKNGNIVAKFEATVDGFINEDNDLLVTQIVLRMPWRTDVVYLKPYEAEFEVIDDE